MNHRASPGFTTGDTVASRYEIREHLRDAPAYAAYRAFDTDSEIEVSLWLIEPSLFPDAARRDAFVGAVVDIRGLSHPHVRRIVDAGRDGEELYLASQPAGADLILLREQQGGKLGAEVLLECATAMAQALDAAHAAGYVHGRLIPEEVAYVGGKLEVGGIGLFVDVDVVAAQERWQAWERYVAPEVRRSGVVLPAADVYSMAAILVELGSGVLGPTPGAATLALRGLSPDLATVLELALSPAPERRPQSPGALLDSLRRALAARSAAPLGFDSAIGDPTVEDHRPRSIAPAGKPRIPEFFNPPGDPTVIASGRNKPVGGPPPAQPRRPRPARPEPPKPLAAVSMKPAGGTRPRPQRASVADMPDRRPVVRPLSSLRSPAASGKALGQYAPPRSSQPYETSRPGKFLWLRITIILVAAVAVLSAAYLVSRFTGIGKAADEPEELQNVDPGSLAPAGPSR